MLIHIKVFTSYVWASTHRTVSCSHCATEYVYAMRCRGVGGSGAPMGLGQERAKVAAQSRAVHQLQHALRSSYEAVPCPKCGQLQPDMTRLLRNRLLRWIAAIWAILVGHALLVSLLAFDPAFKSTLTYGLITAIISTAAAIPIAIYAFKRTYRVNLPPHRRVITRQQAETDGYELLELPYVYPDGGIHIHPAALRLPPRCCGCDAPATRIRAKRLRLVGIAAPFCAPCFRRSIILQATATLAIFLLAAASLAAGILAHTGPSGLVPALIASAFAGLIAAILCWFKYLCHIGIPLRFRRHDVHRDSAILYCQSKAFTESLLAHILQNKSTVQIVATADPERPLAGQSVQTVLQSAQILIPLPS